MVEQAKKLHYKYYSVLKKVYRYLRLFISHKKNSTEIKFFCERYA